MTHILAKYRSKIISRHPISKFMVKIDNCKVELESDKQELTINICGRLGREKMGKLLSELESLIFFYFGSFPLMELLYVNGIKMDISRRAAKYETSDNFLKDNLVICDIDENTVNEQKIKELRKINSYPIYSFQCLLSKASVNIYAFLKAQETGQPVTLCCAIGDEMIDGKPYAEIVQMAREYIQSVGGFEKFAEWGLS